MTFDQFAIDPRCLRILDNQGITEPTPVQDEAIPIALEGRDVLAVAQTGTGKTLAFSLPALTRLAAEKPRKNRMLVLTPTRELAVQVHKVIEQMCRVLKMRSVCIYGGVGMEPQTKALRRGCDIVVATPGRLLDHMGRGNVRFRDLSILVLDEADRMLDMGFLPDIRRILKELPKERQTLFFSATFPSAIDRLTREFLNDPQRIEIGTISKPVDTVRQRVFTVHSQGKLELLSRVLSEPGVDSVIVFVRTQHRTDRVARQLHKKGFKAEAIHGGRSQAQRERALDAFRKGKCTVLVATDVAARGIDVQGVTHVVNYDITTTVDDYVHRIGRTARANASGDAITFVSPEEFKDLGAIEKGLGKNIPREDWEGSVRVPVLFNPNRPAAGRGRRGGPRRRPAGTRRTRRRVATAN